MTDKKKNEEDMKRIEESKLSKTCTALDTEVRKKKLKGVGQD